jgi:hypothetical protein
MDRRKFMALTGVSATTLGVGGLLWRVGGVWWDQEAAPEWQIFSQHEVKIVEALAETIFPGEDSLTAPIPSALDVGVPAFLDAFLANTLDDFTANAVRLLIHAIDEMAIGADFGLTRFHKRPMHERVEILKAWEESSLAPRRGAFSAHKHLNAMGYCESPEVLGAMGISYTCGDLT